jgi:hypothetical protein
MNKPKTITMIVRLVDGNVHRFQFPDEFAADPTTLASRLERGFEAHDLAIETDGRLLVYPKQSILSIEVTPAPAKLPAFAIRHGRMIGG